LVLEEEFNMETPELINLIKTRRSIRKFLDTPVPQELLMQAVETATWASNGGNAQNWRFIIILDKKIINSIEEVIQKDLNIIRSWPEMEKAGPGGARFANPQPGSPLTTAPALIVVVAVRISNAMVDAMTKHAQTDADAKKRLDGLQIVAGWAQSTAAATAYLMLVLHQMGLGSLWMTGPLHAKAEIEKILNLPAGMEVMTLVPVGYPAENPSRTRKPVNEVCTVIK
jgi:nitroreductase